MFVGMGFYLLLFLSALASAIALLELASAWLMRRTGLSRRWSAAVAGALCALAGIPTVLSFNLWSTWRPLAAIPRLESAGFFDVIDFATSDLMLPLAGILLAIFAGWVMPPRVIAAELAWSPAANRFAVWFLRYVVPAAIATVAIVSMIG